MTNPYSNLPSEAFWAKAVGDRHFWSIDGLGHPKRKIAAGDLVATAGSCFAQHISRRLRGAGFAFMDAEPPPRWLRPDRHDAYGFGLYSARYGNVYTAAQLRQLYDRAYDRFKPEERVWETGGRYFDPFRPAIEPDGFATAQEALDSQSVHLRAVKKIFSRAKVLVFTLGLTEGWRSKADGAVYPMCPGTRAGTFDPDKYEFFNQTHSEVLEDLDHVIRTCGRRNPSLRFLFTVSPVPLTATASGQHVLTASTYSKSVLRAVAGELAQTRDNVDYFPSYEIITAPPFRGVFFDRNARKSGRKASIS